MRREFELSLGDDLAHMVEHGYPPATGPSRRLPVDVYTSPERHRRELAAFAARPAAAVHAGEIPDPGDFVTAQLGATPVIVTRNRDGTINALVNVCAHRGATVEHRPSGSQRVLSCGFHGWSYDLDGSLRSVTDERLFATERCERGLRRLACEERHGIVWVTVDPPDSSSPSAVPMTVRDWLGDELDDVFGWLELDTMTMHATKDIDVACNWKMLTDGFLELYHLKFLHRNSIAPYFPSNLIVTILYGDHLATVLPKNRLIRHIAEQQRDEWQILEHLAMPFVLMPGTVVQWQAGHVELFSFRPHPTDPTRTRCRLSLLVPPHQASDAALCDRNWERVCDTIPGEDFVVAEQVQANIDAGALTELQIGHSERFLLEHLAAVDRLVAATTPEAASGNDAVVIQPPAMPAAAEI